MVWTATITKIDKSGSPIAVVSFTDGDKVVTETFDLNSPQDFRNKVEARRLHFEQFYNFIETVDETFVLKTTKVPTQTEIDRNDYFALRGKLERAKLDVELGIIQADDANLAKLLSDVKALYKPEYTGF